MKFLPRRRGLLFAALLLIAFGLCARAEEYPQSPHPYPSNYDSTWTYTHPTAAECLRITFSDDTCTEKNCDIITITGADGKAVSVSGSALGGNSVCVKGRSFSISLKSDGSVNFYGFRIAEIAPISQEEYAETQLFTVSEYGEITGYLGGRKNVVVPRSINGQKIRYIGNEAFKDHTTMESVALPDSIEEIYSHAFDGCASLRSISLPSSVTYIGSRAFLNCTSLTAVELPDGLETLANYAFEGCTALKEISIPRSVSEIRFATFRDCASLAKVELNEGLTKISDLAFKGCTALKTISIPKTVFALGNGAFQDCASLAMVTLNEGLKWISENAFFGCDALKKIVLPKTVSAIGDKALPSECVLYTGENAYATEYAKTHCYYYVSAGGSLLPEDAAFSSAEEKARWVVSTYIKPGMSDYEKALQLYDWVCKNVDYDHEYLVTGVPTGAHGVGKEGALLDGYAVCQGFAEAYQALLELVDIRSIYVRGVARGSGGSHGWNLVLLNGNWYQCDPTWDESGDGYDHDYFMLCDEAMEYDHERQTHLSVRCNAFEMNHAYRNGRYTQVLTDLRQSLNDQLGEGKTSGTLEIPSKYHFKGRDLSTIAKILSYDRPVSGGHFVITARPEEEAALDFVYQASVTGVRGITVDGYDPTAYTSRASLPLGIQVQLSAQTVPKYAAIISYSSSDPSVFTVTGSGALRAVGAGEATLTVTANSYSLDIALRVDEDPRLYIQADSTVLLPGSTTQLTLASYYSTPFGWYSVSWLSSDSAVAAVDSKGEVQALKEGKVTITANIKGAASVSKEFYVSRYASGVEVWQTPIQAAVGDVIRVRGVPTFDDPNVTVERKLWNTFDWNNSNPSVALASPGSWTYRTNGSREKEYTITDVGAALITLTYQDGGNAQGQCLIIAHAENALTLPKQLKTIEPEAFAGGAAQEIVIPSGAMSIGSHAFADMPALKLITIPASVREIAPDAFAGTKNVSILCAGGSPAVAFAEAHGIPWFSE